MTSAGRDEAGLDLRPWAAGVDPSFVVDLLWPLSFQPEEAAPWIGDILERATMAERRLPVLAAWARRWRLRSEGGDELPLVHARWIHDVIGAEGQGSAALSQAIAPVASARRAPGPSSEPEVRPLVHAAKLVEGRGVDGLASASARAAVTGERAATGAGRSAGRAGSPSRASIEVDVGAAASDRSVARAAAETSAGEAPALVPTTQSQASTGRRGSIEIEAMPGITRGRPGVGAAVDPGAAMPSSVQAEIAAAPSRSVTARADARERGEPTDTPAMPHVSSDRSTDAASTPVRVEVAASAPQEPTPRAVTTSVGREAAALDEAPAMPHVAAARTPGAAEQDDASGPRTSVIPRSPSSASESTRSTATSTTSIPASTTTSGPRASVSVDAARPVTQARSHEGRPVDEVTLIDAVDRGSAGRSEGEASAGIATSTTRPRVQARRPDGPARAAPRVHARPGLGDEAPWTAEAPGSARPRVHAAAPSGSGRADALEHLANGSRAADATPSTRRSGADPFEGGETTTATSTQTTPPPPPEAPRVDVEALVTAVKRRLAREIRWERELRRAIG